MRGSPQALLACQDRVHCRRMSVVDCLPVPADLVHPQVRSLLAGDGNLTVLGVNADDLHVIFDGMLEKVLVNLCAGAKNPATGATTCEKLAAMGVMLSHLNGDKLFPDDIDEELALLGQALEAKSDPDEVVQQQHLFERLTALKENAEYAGVLRAGFLQPSFKFVLDACADRNQRVLSTRRGKMFIMQACQELGKISEGNGMHTQDECSDSQRRLMRQVDAAVVALSDMPQPHRDHTAFKELMDGFLLMSGETMESLAKKLSDVLTSLSIRPRGTKEEERINATVDQHTFWANRVLGAPVHSLLSKNDPKVVSNVLVQPVKEILARFQEHSEGIGETLVAIRAARDLSFMFSGSGGQALTALNVQSATGFLSQVKVACSHISAKFDKSVSGDIEKALSQFEECHQLSPQASKLYKDWGGAQTQTPPLDHPHQGIFSYHIRSVKAKVRVKAKASAKVGEGEGPGQGQCQSK